MSMMLKAMDWDGKRLLGPTATGRAVRDAVKHYNRYLEAGYQYSSSGTRHFIELAIGAPFGTIYHLLEYSAWRYDYIKQEKRERDFAPFFLTLTQCMAGTLARMPELARMVLAENLEWLDDRRSIHEDAVISHDVWRIGVDGQKILVRVESAISYDITRRMNFCVEGLFASNSFGNRQQVT